MKIYHQKQLFKAPIVIAIALSATLILSGCVQIRLITYPAEFKWLDPSTIQNTMYDLASSMGTLEVLVDLATDSNDTQMNNDNILAELSKVELLASSLVRSTSDPIGDSAETPVTNHLLIDEHIDEFIDQVMRARFLAENVPPNYYGVGRLTGSCAACHGVR